MIKYISPFCRSIQIHFSIHCYRRYTSGFCIYFYNFSFTNYKNIFAIFCYIHTGRATIEFS